MIDPLEHGFSTICWGHHHLLFMALVLSWGKME
jgi:hypothetical protein